MIRARSKCGQNFEMRNHPLERWRELVEKPLALVDQVLITFVFDVAETHVYKTRQTKNLAQIPKTSENLHYWSVSNFRC